MMLHRFRSHVLRMLLAVDLLLAICAGPVAAGPPPETDPSQPGPGFSQVFVRRLRADFGLSDGQVLKLLPELERVESIRAESRARRRRLAGELRRLSTRETVAADEVARWIDTLDDEEQTATQLQLTVRNTILESLTPRQRAGFLVLTARFEQHIRQGGDDRGARTGQPSGRRERPSNRPDAKPGATAGGDPDDSVSLFFVHRLRRSLQLSEDQALGLLPQVRELEAALAASRQRREQLVTELARLARSAAPEPESVNTIVAALDREQLDAAGTQRRIRSAMLARLEPAQQAGFILLTHRFADRLDRRNADPGTTRPLGGPPEDARPAGRRRN